MKCLQHLWTTWRWFCENGVLPSIASLNTPLAHSSLRSPASFLMRSKACAGTDNFCRDSIQDLSQKPNVNCCSGRCATAFKLENPFYQLVYTRWMLFICWKAELIKADTYQLKWTLRIKLQVRQYFKTLSSWNLYSEQLSLTELFVETSLLPLISNEKINWVPDISYARWQPCTHPLHRAMPTALFLFARSTECWWRAWEKCGFNKIRIQRRHIV